MLSNSVDPDEARLLVEPELRPNCLQTFSAVDTSSDQLKCMCSYLVGLKACIFWWMPDKLYCCSTGLRDTVTTRFEIML